MWNEINKFIDRLHQSNVDFIELTPREVEIKTAYDKLIGKQTKDTFIYVVLRRNNWRMVMPRSQHPKKASAEEIESSKKLKQLVQEATDYVNLEKHRYCNVRLLFQDEAGFGRINKPKRCWCPSGVRPITPCQHILEYRYAYHAVEPLTGNSFFLVMPYCNTDCMNVYMAHLSKAYPNDLLLMAMDRASWHRSKGLIVPENIRILHIPPYTPEMNPIEQIWKELRKLGFRNEFFKTLDIVIERLCETINSLTCDLVKSITGRDWIISMF